MTTHRVEVDGQTVWSGDTDYKGIPDEHRRRPDNTPEGVDHPSAKTIYARGEDGQEVVVAVLKSETQELQELLEHLNPLLGFLGEPHVQEDRETATMRKRAREDKRLSELRLDQIRAEQAQAQGDQPS